MTVKVNGLNLKITEGMQTAIEHKLESLEKFIKNSEISVKVTQKKLEVKIVIMLVYNGKLIKITERDEDFYVALEKVTDTLKSQIKKLHTLKIKREQDQSETIRNYFSEEEVEDDEDNPKIIKRKSINLLPMTEEDAINSMEVLGHTSFLFLNSDMKNAISMIYRRNDGNYGILEQI